MKKILFISLFCSALGFFASCSVDEESTDQVLMPFADDTGGQHGIPKPPPPPPPPPSYGSD
ncbi:hypothetical protein [Flavobacterium sp.]|uniref:hypothetical protein n=1 Tax=Flavobacterium sp. TaxID=239 RepID=UPI002FD88B13